MPGFIIAFASSIMNGKLHLILIIICASAARQGILDLENLFRGYHDYFLENFHKPFRQWQREIDLS